MTASKSEQEAFRDGMSDGAKGTDEHKPDGGFIDTILNSPLRDCTNDERDRAYEAGHQIGETSRK